MHLLLIREYIVKKNMYSDYLYISTIDASIVYPLQIIFYFSLRISMIFSIMFIYCIFYMYSTIDISTIYLLKN